jgi:hypothetical protein
MPQREPPQGWTAPSKHDAALRSMWCNSTRSEGTFVYLGADVDVELLRILQPPESRILFMDALQLPHGFDYLSEWEREHAASTQLSYRVTTRRIRSMANATEKLLALRSLLGHRLADVFGGPISVELTPARATSLEATFVYQGRTRHLEYAMGQFDDFGRIAFHPPKRRYRRSRTSAWTSGGGERGRRRWRPHLVPSHGSAASVTSSIDRSIGLDDFPWPNRTNVRVVSERRWRCSAASRRASTSPQSQQGTLLH